MPPLPAPPKPPEGDENNLPAHVREAITAWVYHDDVAWWFERAASQMVASLVEQGIVVVTNENERAT